MSLRFAHRIDMKFSYTPAAATNVAKTIAKERKRLADEAAKREQETPSKVRQIKKVAQ